MKTDLISDTIQHCAPFHNYFTSHWKKADKICCLLDLPAYVDTLYQDILAHSNSINDLEDVITDCLRLLRRAHFLITRNNLEYNKAHHDGDFARAEHHHNISNRLTENFKGVEREYLRLSRKVIRLRYDQIRLLGIRRAFLSFQAAHPAGFL